MDCLEIYRDCQVHIECGAVLFVDQNSRIFDDWKLHITSLTALNDVMCFSNKTRVSFNCGIFDCGCNIHFSVLIFVLFE
jgi:hypothetical protein